MKTDGSHPISFTPKIGEWAAALWQKDLAKRIDTLTSEHYFIESAALMETAGRSVAQVAIEFGAEKFPVIIACGSGNNGGDGLVAARCLYDLGCNIHVVTVFNQERPLSPLCQKQLSTIQAMGVKITPWTPGTFKALNLVRPMIIDALTGIGFRHPYEGPTIEALKELSLLSDATVIAVDLPSGLSSDEGSQKSAPLPAHVTVTFGSAKPVHRLMPAAQSCGQIRVIPIGFPETAVQKASFENPPTWHEVTPQKILSLDPWSMLRPDGNKYDRGHVLVIGGSPGKIGAPILAGLAAMRSGAGWCSLGIPRGSVPTDMQIPVECTVESFFNGEDINALQLKEFLEQRRVRAVICGPGWMGQQLSMQSLKVLYDFADGGGSVIFDGGALHGLLDLMDELGPIPQKGAILTPHPGEWRKLQKNPLDEPLSKESAHNVLERFKRLGVHALFKNAAPIILSHTLNTPIVCHTGTTILARAGSGDLLTGIIGAHMAMGCEPGFAMGRAYTLMSRSALLCARELGEGSVLGTDILTRIGIAARL